MRHPSTGLAQPVLVELSGPIPGQEQLNLWHAGYKPPAAGSPSYPFVPLDRPARPAAVPCGFCADGTRLIANGASWTDAAAPRFVACPRCGSEPVERGCRNCGDAYSVAPVFATSTTKWASLCAACRRLGNL